MKSGHPKKRKASLKSMAQYDSNLPDSPNGSLKKTVTAQIAFHAFARSRSFLFGLLLPLNAARLVLQSRKLLFWSIFPILLTALVYFYFIREAQNWAHESINNLFMSWGIAEGSWIFWFLKAMEWIILLILAAVTFSISSSIVAAPFNDVLAEKTEPLATPPLQPVPGGGFSQTLRVIWIDFMKSLVAGLVFIGVLITLLIPFVNILGAMVGLLVVSFQYVNYPQSRRGMGVKSSAQFLWQFLYANLGFGLAMSFLLGLPVISALFLPLGVVGGTLLYARASTQQGPFKLK
jgi:uncharacterized protein involved in cysteine biosynthesis